MQKVHRPQDKWRDVVFGCVALLVIVIDQLVKVWIKINLSLGQSIVDWDYFRIIHIHNTGAAFGIFKDHTTMIIYFVFLEVVVILLLVYFLHSRLSFLDSYLLRVGAGMVLGGAIGNQIDRLRVGYVTDFIDFRVWPAFNVADASAVVGVIIIAVCVLFLTQKVKHQE
jgi:signal peptidase II